MTTPHVNRAFRIHRFGGPEVLRVEELPVPAPRDGEVLVSVRAAGVNQLDWKFREGWVPQLGIELPTTLGVEFAGVVSTVGGGVSGVGEGDRVMGHLQKFGAYTDHLTVDAAIVSHIPGALGDVEAAALPISVVTAWQALHAPGVPKPGATVLILGASGAVGGFAVQFAKQVGARVIATASARNAAHVAALGADHVIDHHSERVEDHVHDADLVLDFVGGDTTDRSWPVLKRGGALVSAATPDVSARAPDGVRGLWVMGTPDPPLLERVARDVADGRIRSTIADVFDANDLRTAIERTRQPHPAGKVVVDFTPNSTAQHR